jgi:hypothetical protein
LKKTTPRPLIGLPDQSRKGSPPSGGVKGSPPSLKAGTGMTNRKVSETTGVLARGAKSI